MQSSSSSSASSFFGSLPRLSQSQSRSISPENFTGAKGEGGKALKGTGADAARELGQGWKVSPSINLPPNQETVIAEIDGPGVIQHFWCTVHHSAWRKIILRISWDHEQNPSVEVPLGDFFCNGWCEPSNVNSFPIAVNPYGGFNSYWTMPFRTHARISLVNVFPEEIGGFYYSINYALTPVPDDYAYFHAQWRRSNPLQAKVPHTILENVKGAGHYVGTYIAWGAHNNGWWGEGEIKFFMDGDDPWPTICGTGTEDYFGGAWCFLGPDGEYGTYSTPFLGFHQFIRPLKIMQNGARFGMYRWHIPDPIRFQENLKVTIQALGWRTAQNGKGLYLALQDDIASTAFWYQNEPHSPVNPSLTFDDLEVI